MAFSMVCDLFLNESKISCLKIHTFYFIYRFCLNPYWLFLNNRLHKGIRILLINCENSLGIINSLDTGR